MTSDLGKRSSGHLHATLVRGVDLEVVSVRAVQAQQPQSRRRTVVTLAARVNAPEGFAQHLGLCLAGRCQLTAPLQYQHQRRFTQLR